MAGRPQIPFSYVVSLREIARQILIQQRTRQALTHVWIPVYENCFGEDIARNLMFVGKKKIWKATKTDWGGSIKLMIDGAAFEFFSSFGKAPKKGLKFGTMEIPYPTNEAGAICLNYYWT